MYCIMLSTIAIPIYVLSDIASFKSKDSSFTCLFPFFGFTLHITFLFKLPEVNCCCLPTSCLYALLLELCYVHNICQLSLLQLLIYRTVIFRGIA